MRDWLVPELRPEQLVVQDNLLVHHNAEARAAAGCRLEFLPVSSPDYNPIELVVATVQAQVRGAKARTADAVAVMDAIGAALDHLTATEVTAYCRHCGARTAGPPPRDPL